MVLFNERFTTKITKNDRDEWRKYIHGATTLGSRNGRG